jgi:hypothetical protein
MTIVKRGVSLCCGPDLTVAIQAGQRAADLVSVDVLFPGA